MSDYVPINSDLSLLDDFSFGVHKYIIPIVSIAIIIAAICGLFVTYFINNKNDTATCVDEQRRNYLLYTSLLFNSVAVVYLLFLAWKLFKSGKTSFGLIISGLIAVLVTSIIVQAISIAKIDPSAASKNENCMSDQLLTTLRTVNVISFVSSIILGFFGFYIGEKSF